MNSINTNAEKQKHSSARLEELRKKVHDEAYIYSAIQRIAQILSKEIMNGYGEINGSYKSKH